MRRALLQWTLVFALLAAGFGAAVLALSNDLYSAHGFVRSYLSALQSHDAEGALAMDGVGGASGLLLTDAAVGGFDNIRLLSDVEKDGTHTVRYAYTIAGDEQVSEYEVERTGTRLGLFATWRFAISPVATLAVTVDHDARFTANGVAATTGSYAVLVPTALTLGHDTKWLEALDTSAQVTEVGSTVEALVEVAPKDEFDEAASTAVMAFLDQCATQQVLKPTGCPFGADVANRLEGLPQWSITAYPTVALNPSDTPGAWQTTPAEGTAHITATIQSLFDGTVTTLDQDEPFSASYLVTVGLDDSLTVTLA